MLQVCGVEFKPGTEEELLPNFNLDFPHISTCLEFQNNTVQQYPWHWHKAVEIFYVERGSARKFHTFQRNHISGWFRCDHQLQYSSQRYRIRF